MKEIIDLLINGHWWQVIIAIVIFACLIRIVYEILTNKD